MRVLELFSGTQSVGKVGRALGYDVISLDLTDATIFFILFGHWSGIDAKVVCELLILARGNRWRSRELSRTTSTADL